jgi:hypothetical protein
MLDTLTPGEFNELMAADIVDPDPLDRIAEILKLIGATQCVGDVKPDDFEPPRKVFRTDRETQTEVYDSTEDTTPVLSPNQAAAWAAMSFRRAPDNQRR